MRPSDPRPDFRLASMIVVERRLAELLREAELARIAAAVRRQPAPGRLGRPGVARLARMVRALAWSVPLWRRRIVTDVDGVGRRGA